MAFFAADGGSNSGSKEGAAEEMNGVFGGTFVRQAFDFIVGDEVDLGMEAFGVLREEAGLFGAIVDPGEENIFKED